MVHVSGLGEKSPSPPRREVKFGYRIKAATAAAELLLPGLFFTAISDILMMIDGRVAQLAPPIAFYYNIHTYLSYSELKKQLAG